MTAPGVRILPGGILAAGLGDYPAGLWSLLVPLPVALAWRNRSTQVA